MPDFNAKMLQNRFRLGLRPRPHCGSLQRSPDPYLDLRGLLLRGGREGREEGERERRKWGGEGKGRGARPVCLLVLTILATGLCSEGYELPLRRFAVSECSYLSYYITLSEHCTRSTENIWLRK